MKNWSQMKLIPRPVLGLLAGSRRPDLHLTSLRYTLLSQSGGPKEELENILNITPGCDPRTLSLILTAIGGDRATQQHNTFFIYLTIFDVNLLIASKLNMTETIYILNITNA
jgi:hypothetical protein